MEFLCPHHRSQFARLTLDERKDLWSFWMDTAYGSCEQGQWQDVVSLVGSAFDLACLDGPDPTPGLFTELTLSAILVSRVLTDLGDHAATRRVTFRALQRLQSCYAFAPAEAHGELELCVTVLMDTTRQPSFFSDHMNWQTRPFTQPERAWRVRTLH